MQELLTPVRQSYGRCAMNPNFIDYFYEEFLKSHPSIKPMFSNTDFKKQKELLRTGIGMLLAHLEGKPAGTMTLDRIAESHNKQHMNINPNLYQFWIDSLIKSVKQCDQKFSPDLERSWQKVLRAGVDYITARYDAPAS
ncbi:MAG: globin [Nitrospirales bacterium]|nr:globin [Nitrospira sp.]MDR4501517.1 globin [Nitrospirales bacterium]